MAAQKQSKDYRHSDEKALLRPEAGAQDVFPDKKRKPAQKYRYDSSLAPELQWDEAQTRAEAEQHINAVLNADSLETARAAAEKLRALNSHFLNWSGKAGRYEVEVPSLPLFVHERLSADAILKTLERHKRERSYTLQMFGEGDKSIGEAIKGAYEHLNGWQNRLILGDSLQVMNSLITYEHLGGKVQMVYIDPPYGVSFGSNFMPFVRKRNFKNDKDGELTREPEMVKAYRDTWTLGIHSWLTYMRDRLMLAREMLTESGSVFVQISDENVHLVRSIMDEIFGRNNFVNQIHFQKTGYLGSDFLDATYDYIIWYAKDKSSVKNHTLFEKRSLRALARYGYLEKEDGTSIKLNTNQLQGYEEIPRGKRWRDKSLFSEGETSGKSSQPFEFEGRVFQPTPGKHWSTTVTGLKHLADKGRIVLFKDRLYFKSYEADLPVVPINVNWEGMMVGKKLNYVVETAEKVIQRCMLMTTNPGDLVLDPTCGSGTTALVAEKWGRRWITCDVSRVPLALTRQRLLTSTYDYYKLRNEQMGPAGGFVYESKQNAKGEEIGGIIPHITLESIAHAEPPAEEVLVDKPERDTKFVRITGPFCVEAVMPPADTDPAVPPPSNLGQVYLMLILMMKPQPIFSV